MEKLNRLVKWSFLVILFTILIYTRFINLSWGLPYPFHPDERNIASSVTSLNPADSFHPHFFAYGQFTIYASYILVTLYHLITSAVPGIDFVEAIKALRLIAAFSSVATAILIVKSVLQLVKTVEHSQKNEHLEHMALVISFYMVLFVPVFIQFSHFGTTESILMFFYTSLIYVSIVRLKNLMTQRSYSIISSLICGIAIATKISSILFLLIPFFVFWVEYRKQTYSWDRLLLFFFSSLRLILVVIFISFIFSPYNFIDFKEFIGSMRYESEVALGKAKVFYTRSFEDTIPVLFQIIHIFPYALGIPITALFALGFILLPRDKKEFTLLKISFLSIFLPNAIMYAKWTRFEAPVYPVIVIIATTFLILLYYNLTILVNSAAQKSYVHVLLSCVLCVFVFIASLPGMAYLSIYTGQDVRMVASEWIYKALPAQSYILSETANVVDIPSPLPGNIEPLPAYQIISFDSYGVDENSLLEHQFNEHIEQADYIFVPSRRVFMNHTCERPDDGEQTITERIDRSLVPYRCDKLKKRYPILDEYYRRLFSGELGFVQVAEIASYPHVNIFGQDYVLKDEEAEETWTVFDHPVIRIYKRAQPKTAL